MTEIYLVRHGETDWNRARRIQGRTDIPLNTTGREQAAATGLLLASRKWDAIIASPLSRAFETASIIAAHNGLPTPSTLDAVMERNYGEAEGLSVDEIDSKYPGGTEVPGRETRDEVTARTLPALIALAQDRPGQALIVVSHGGVIRSILNAVEHDPGAEKIRNGSVHSFRHVDGALELIAFDDPIEKESLDVASVELEEQNAIENREAAETLNR